MHISDTFHYCVSIIDITFSIRSQTSKKVKYLLMDEMTSVKMGTPKI